MASAASRAMATRLPLDIEPEASSTSVTLSGVSVITSGALNATRAMYLPLSSGCTSRSDVMAKRSLAEGAA